MAFEKDLIEEQENQEEQSGMQQLSQPMAAPAAAQPAGGQQAQTAERKPVSKPGSGMFTNIQKYYKQPTQEAAKKMATSVGEAYEKRFQDIQTGTQEKVGAFEQAIAPEEQRLQTAGERVGEYLQQAGTQLSPEEAERRREEIQKVREGQYADPTDIDLAQQRLQAQTLQKQVTDPSQEAITRQALKSVYERPDYFQGMRNLDYMLMRQKGAQDILRDKAQQVGQQVQEFDVAGQEEALRQRDVELGELARSYRDEGERSIAQQFQTTEDVLRQNIMARQEEEAATRMQALQDLYEQDVNLASITPYVTGVRQLEERELITPEQLARGQALRELAGREGFQFQTPDYFDPENLRSIVEGTTPKYGEQLRTIAELEGGAPLQSEAELQDWIRGKLTDEYLERGGMMGSYGWTENQEAIGPKGYKEAADYLAYKAETPEELQRIQELLNRGSMLPPQDIMEREQLMKAAGFDTDDPYIRNEQGDIVRDKYTGLVDTDLYESGLIQEYLRGLESQRDALRRYGYETDDTFLKEMSDRFAEAEWDEQARSQAYKYRE